MRNDGPERPKHVAFIDDIIKGLLCLTVIYIYIYIYVTAQWDGFHEKKV